jgi:peptide deformylase
MKVNQGVTTETMAASILQLGDPRLRQVSAPVMDFADFTFRENHRQLHATLAAFRRVHGFGRAISAPQIGVPQRFIALNLGTGPQLLVNPEVTWTSQETFTMWDDCMSFPSLLVRVQRYQSISICYLNEHGNRHEWPQLDRALSELLQHEIDHLDGVLAVDRALDRDALVLREVFEAQRAYFLRQVDYVIGGKG